MHFLHSLPTGRNKINFRRKRNETGFAISIVGVHAFQLLNEKWKYHH